MQYVMVQHLRSPAWGADNLMTAVPLSPVRKAYTAPHRVHDVASICASALRRRG